MPARTAPYPSFTFSRGWALIAEVDMRCEGLPTTPCCLSCKHKGDDRHCDQQPPNREPHSTQSHGAPPKSMNSGSPFPRPRIDQRQQFSRQLWLRLYIILRLRSGGPFLSTLPLGSLRADVRSARARRLPGDECETRRLAIATIRRGSAEIVPVGANPESRAIFDHAVCATGKGRVDWDGDTRTRTPLGVQLE